MKKSLLILISLLIHLSNLFAQGGEILHYRETTGYNHGTANQSSNLFQGIANTIGLGFVDDGDGSEFDTYANLQRFDLVIFSNTSGDQGLNANQRANFEQYIANGGSYLGIHAASDTYRHSSANGNNTGNWDWYAETVCGASVQENPNHTANNYAGTMTFLQTGIILDNQMQNPWNKVEEYYYWQNGYLSLDFTPILEVSQTGPQVYDVARMTAHIRDLPGGGRAFYTSLGHASSNFDINTDFGQFMENAVMWIRSGSTLFVELEEPEVIAELSPTLINPADGKISLSLTAKEAYLLKIDVHDLAGRHLHRFEREVEEGFLIWENKIDLPAGVYMLSVHSNGTYFLTEKIWVQ